MTIQTKSQLCKCNEVGDACKVSGTLKTHSTDFDQQHFECECNSVYKKTPLGTIKEPVAV